MKFEHDINSLAALEEAREDGNAWLKSLAAEVAIAVDAMYDARLTRRAMKLEKYSRVLTALIDWDKLRIEK